MTSTVNHAPPAYAGTAVGGIGVPVYAGVIFGTAAVSLLADAMGSVSNAFAIVALLAAIGALALAKARRVATRSRTAL